MQHDVFLSRSAQTVHQYYSCMIFTVVIHASRHRQRRDGMMNIANPCLTYAKKGDCFSVACAD